MNYYAPIGAMQVMGASASAAGALQMPRTLITIILPTIAGAWVGKKAANAWKAMVIGTSLAMIPMAVMALVTNSGASIMIYFVALAVTGIAEKLPCCIHYANSTGNAGTGRYGNRNFSG